MKCLVAPSLQILGSSMSCPVGTDIPLSCSRKGGRGPPGLSLSAHWLAAQQATGAPLALFLCLSHSF